jgi:ZIP family zinc transporter
MCSSTSAAILGATFALGTKQGILLTVALAVGLLFLSLSVATTLRQANVAHRAIVLTVGLISLALPLGAAGGAILLRHADASMLAAVLAFGAVVLMYVVTEELLVRAHRVRSSQWAMPLFFASFLAYLVIVQMLG